jgi:nitrite reductase (NADH) small subunit
MSEFIDVGQAADIAVGRVRAFDVSGRTIAVYHTPSGFFATDNQCPHRGGPLAEGDLIGNEITCGWHLWSFDVTTGHCMGNPEIRVASHEVKVEQDRLLVRLR